MEYAGFPMSFSLSMRVRRQSCFPLQQKPTDGYGQLRQSPNAGRFVVFCSSVISPFVENKKAPFYRFVRTNESALQIL